MAETQRLQHSFHNLLGIKKSIPEDTLEYVLEDIRCGGASKVSLSNRAISPEKFKEIARLLTMAASVDKLDLSGGLIRSDGAEDLVKVLNSNLPLRQLHLANNALGDQGVILIASALPACTTLVLLDLADNMITMAGARALSAALLKNSQLTFLDLSRNNLGPDGAQALATALADNQSLRKLNLQYTKLGNEGIWAIADALNENFVLESLILKGNQVEDAGVLAVSEALMDNLVLTHLDLSWNRIADGGALGLSDALKINESLTSIDLSYNRIGTEGAESLADAFAQNPSLTELNLRRNKIGDAGASALASTLGDDTATQLKVLDVSGNRIRDAGVVALSVALIGNNTLTALDISSNEFSDTGAASLFSGLESNATLQALFLRRARIKGYEVFMDLKSSLGIDSVSAIKVLDLSYVALGETALRYIAEALKLNKTVEQLSLHSCGVTSEGGKALAEVLVVNSTLKDLDLSSNCLQDQGVAALADALSQNTSLHTLYLGFNSIGDNGVCILASVLQADSAIERLSLDCNAISDLGAIAIANGLLNTNKLANLDLGNNRIGDAGAEALCGAIAEKKSVLVVDLHGNPVENGSLLEKVKWATQINRGLTESRKVQQMKLERTPTGREVKDSTGPTSPSFTSTGQSQFTDDGTLVHRSISLRAPVAAPSPGQADEAAQMNSPRARHWSDIKAIEWTSSDVLSWMVWLGIPSEFVERLCAEHPTGKSLPLLIESLNMRPEFAVMDNLARKGTIAALEVATKNERWNVQSLKTESGRPLMMKALSGDEKFWSVDQVSAYLAQSNVPNQVIEAFAERAIHGPLLSNLSLHELDLLLPTANQRPERRGALKALSKVTETAIGMMQSDRSNRKVERILTATSRRKGDVSEGQEQSLSAPSSEAGSPHEEYGDVDLFRLNMVPSAAPLYDDFSGGMVSATPAVQYDAFDLDTFHVSDLNQGAIDASRSILRSTDRLPALDQAQLAVETRSSAEAVATTFLGGKLKDPSTASIDTVKFSTFAPPMVFPGLTFSLDIWAFLPRQRSEMLSLASEGGSTERSPLSSLSIRRGALVTIVLELPSDYFFIDEPGGKSKWFSWTGEITKVPFNVHCKGPIGQLIQASCSAKIIVGYSVAVLQFSLVIGSQKTEPTLLDSKLEVPPLSYKDLNYQDIVLKQFLAKGNFGETYLADYKGQKVVVKKMLNVHSEDIVANLKHEAALLNHFGHHPNIVSFVGACTDPNSPLCVVTEYVEGGSVEDAVYQSKHRAGGRDELDLRARTRILRDASCGIVNIHEGNVLHRDIAARNCLLTDELRVKICDFGLSRSHGTAKVVRGRGYGPLKWMAPESVRPPHLFSQASDAYMFGMLCWEVLAGVEPYPGIPVEEAVRMKLEGAEVRIPSGALLELTPDHERILAACLQHDPDRRPHLGRVLEDLDVLVQRL